MNNQSQKKVVVPILFIVIFLVLSLFSEITMGQTSPVLSEGVETTISSYGRIINSSLNLDVTIDSPKFRYYITSKVPIQLSSVSADSILWNIHNGTQWLYSSQQTYTSETEATLGNGEYKLHVWVNQGSNQVENTVIFGVNLRNTGAVYASGGSNTAIQEAINSASNGYAVYLPVGTYQFDVESPWTTVTVPAGISIYGAPALRDSNGQVIEWNTVLTAYDWAMIDLVSMFKYSGSSNYLTRFTGVKLVGYHETHPTYVGARIVGITTTSSLSEFRIDHVYFRNIRGYNVNWYCGKGLFDHNKVINTPITNLSTEIWDQMDCWYSINLNSVPDNAWTDPIHAVYGLFTSKTLVVEDNYFEGIFSPVQIVNSAHMIARYNEIQRCVIVFGLHQESFGSKNGQAVEAYENKMTNPYVGSWANPSLVGVGGGGAIVYNNTSNGYGTGSGGDDLLCLIYLRNANPLASTYCLISDTYVWNNAMTNGNDVIDIIPSVYEDVPKPVLDVDYFLRAPSMVQDGWIYTPYPYPHPLVDQ